MPSLPYWLSPGDDRPPSEIDDEVAEELRLHLDLLAEERMRQGVAPDEAKRAAAERFGDYDQILRRCRAEKQGDLPMLKRIQAVLTLLLLLVVVWLGVRDYFSAATIAEYMTQTTTFLITIQSDLAEMRGEMQLSKEAQKAALSDTNGSTDLLSANATNLVSILVLDSAGTPIPEAKLSIGWTNKDRDYFDWYEESTDSEGRYTASLRDQSNKTLESVTAFAPGYTFVSKKLNRPGGFSEPLRIVLPESVETRVRVRAVTALAEDSPDDEGPELSIVSNSKIYPVSRTDSSNVMHSVQSGYSTLTDSNGYATIRWFANGDLATLAFEWDDSVGANQTRPFKIVEDADGPFDVEERVIRQRRSFGGGGGAF